MNREFENVLGSYLEQAERYTTVRQDLYDRYMGEPYGNETEGLSQVVTSECFDVVESTVAELVDLIAADDRVVSFAPENAQDEKQAELETDACNHVFWNENDGFGLLQTWLRSGLIEQVGYIKAGWQRKDRVSVDEVDTSGNDEIERTIKTAAKELDAEVEDTDEGLRVVRVDEVDEYVIEPIAQNRIRLAPRWHKLSLKECPFVAIEHDTLTRSDLKAMGFDPDQVDALVGEEQDDDDDNRHNTADNTDEFRDGLQGDNECPTVFECYMLYDEEGTQRRYKCWYGNNELMRWESGDTACEVTDSVPIYAWTPIPVPFRHVGRSLVEIVDNLQAVGTNLTRNMIDNIIRTNIARPIVGKDGATKDTFTDLAVMNPGAPVRATDVTQVSWYAPPPMAQNILPIMEFMKGVKEERTGVTRLNQGLDAETLNKTASGQAQLLSQGAKRMKLIARNAAEAFMELMLGIHRDLRKGNWEQMDFKSGGMWQRQSPQTWRERKRTMVSVGTGNGDRSEKQAGLQMIGGVQRELMAAGSPMVDEGKLFETADRAMKLMGFVGATPFLHQPGGEEYKQKVAQKQAQPKQPDPAMVLAQAEASKAQAQAAKAQADAQLTLAKIQSDEAKAAQEHEREMLKLQIEMQKVRLGETKAAMEFELGTEKQDLAEEQAEHDREMDLVDRLTQ